MDTSTVYEIYYDQCCDRPNRTRIVRIQGQDRTVVATVAREAQHNQSQEPDIVRALRAVTEFAIDGEPITLVAYNSFTGKENERHDVRAIAMGSIR